MKRRAFVGRAASPRPPHHIPAKSRAARAIRNGVQIICSIALTLSGISVQAASPSPVQWQGSDNVALEKWGERYR